MWVSFLCGQLLSETNYDVQPTRQQKHFGIVCYSDTATFRVPQEKLDLF